MLQEVDIVGDDQSAKETQKDFIIQGKEDKTEENTSEKQNKNKSKTLREIFQLFTSTYCLDSI